MDDKIVYNREAYLNSLLDVVKSGKAEAEIKTQLEAILGNVEKQVALMTYERNMSTFVPVSSYVPRI